MPETERTEFYPDYSVPHTAVNEGGTEFVIKSHIYAGPVTLA